MECKIVYPFIDMERFKNVESFDGGYYLAIGRPSSYKRFDLVLSVCRKLQCPLKIITGGMSEEMVTRILAGCTALIIAGIEDFGLVSLEAQALGKPVVAFAAGGALETVVADKTGILFTEQSEESLQEALQRLNLSNIKSADCVKNAANFSKENFINNFKATVDFLLYTK